MVILKCTVILNKTSIIYRIVWNYTLLDVWYLVSKLSAFYGNTLKSSLYQPKNGNSKSKLIYNSNRWILIVLAVHCASASQETPEILEPKILAAAAKWC